MEPSYPSRLQVESTPITAKADKTSASNQAGSMGPIKHKALINVDLGEGYGNLKCVSISAHDSH